MYDNKKILAVIPARSGSKRLKNKNILEFAGKPLISWSIHASMRSKYIDKTVVSTDGEEIARIAKDAGAEVPFMRPSELATGDAKTEDALRHCIKWLKNKNNFYDYIMLLQPTSPLRTENHVDQAIESYFERKISDEDTLISVRSPGSNEPSLMKESHSGYLVFSDAKKNENSKDLYAPNGAIYFGPVDVVEKIGFYGSNILPFYMDRRVSVDIDTREDFDRALKFLQKDTIFEGA